MEGMKRSLFPILIVALSSCSASSSSSFPSLTEGLLFALRMDSSSYALVGKGEAEGKDILVPSSYKGLPVKEVGEEAFCMDREIEGFSIEGKVETIGSRAFSSCDSLIYLSLPDCVISINDAAFEKCSSLTSLSVGGGLDNLAPNAFSGCTSLEEVFWDSPSTIGEFILEAESLIDLSLGRHFLNISPSWFSESRYLKSIFLPDTVLSIADGSFSTCPSLEDAFLGKGLTYLGKGAFSGCSSLKRVLIPSSLEKINEGSFSDCSLLEKIYYFGNEEEWGKMEISSGNDPFLEAVPYFYSEKGEEETSSGRWWHYSPEGEIAEVVVE